MSPRPAAPRTPSENPPSAEQPRPQPTMPTRPSLVTIAASALTAVTSTIALSYLGVAGTIVGAVVAAILTAFANYAYTRSLVRTQVVVTQLAPRYLRTATSAEDTAVLDPVPAGPADVPPLHDETPTGLLEPTVTTDAIPVAAAPEVAIVTRETPVVARVTEESTGPSVPAPATPPVDERVGRDLMAPTRRSPRRTFALVAVTTFVVIILTLTVVELGLGRPLSKALRGVEGSGTTISRVRERARPVTPTEKPTTRPSDEPTTDAPTTPTEEPTTDAPTVTPSPTPTDEPTDPATPVPPATPTDVPTDAPTPELPRPGGTPVPEPPAPQDDASVPADEAAADDVSASSSLGA